MSFSITEGVILKAAPGLLISQQPVFYKTVFRLLLGAIIGCHLNAARSTNYKHSKISSEIALKL